MPGACSATSQAGLLRGWRRARADSAEPALPAGAGHPPHVAAARGRHDSRDATCSTSGRPRRRSRTNPRVRFDYQALPSLRISYKFQGQIARRQVNQGSIPGLNNTLDAVPGRRHGRSVGQLQPELDDVPRGHVRPRLEQAGQLSDRYMSDARTAGLAGLPTTLPGRQHHQSRILRLRRAERGRAPRRRTGTAPVCGRHRTSPGATGFGNTVNGPPNIGLNNLREHPTRDVCRQPDENRGPAHVQGRVLPQSQHQARVRRSLRNELRDDQLCERYG